MLKPSQPLPLREHERVRVSIGTTVSRVRATSGLLGWTGDAETVKRVALDPDFTVREAP